MNTLSLCIPFLGVLGALAADGEPDPGKRLVELPLKRELAVAAAAEDPLPGHVRPGLVPWHASYEDALAAAKLSGKPVLLFQLLGRLDDALC